MSLSKEQIEKFKGLLVSEKRGLEKEIADISSSQGGALIKTAFPDFHDVPGAQDEKMDEVEAYESLLSVHRHLSHRLEEINKALARLEEGTYGWCENCKEEIPLERLEANPAANTCITCSEK